MTENLVAWSVFAVGVTVMLLLDLGLFNRKEKETTMANALGWSAIWISSALIFCLAIYFQLVDAGGSLKVPLDKTAAVATGEHAATADAHGEKSEHGNFIEIPHDKLDAEQLKALAKQNALEFLTGYLIEESLSVDNLFVFVIIFQFFRVPGSYQRAVLYWGILGAIVMRAIFIAAGIVLIQRFSWIIYIFGAFLVYTGIKLALKSDEEVHPEKNIVLRLYRRFFPVTTEYHGRKFFIRQNGKLVATPLFVVLLVVETTDLIFAVDSIPAILGITHNPFIVYTSNVFAIMGLRSLYFALAGLMQQFHYLKYGLSAILTFVGVKMLIAGFYHMPVQLALGIVLGILATCVIASILFPPKEQHAETDESVPNQPPQA